MRADVDVMVPPGSGSGVSLADLWLTDGAGGGWDPARRDTFMCLNALLTSQPEVAKPVARGLCAAEG